jgi:hypothetical protein
VRKLEKKKGKEELKLDVKPHYTKDWLYVWRIYYKPEEQEIVDKFHEFCKIHGYKHISGILTLLKWADYTTQLTILAHKVSELNAKIVELEGLIKAKPSKKPKTMGSDISPPKKKK